MYAFIWFIFLWISLRGTVSIPLLLTGESILKYEDVWYPCLLFRCVQNIWTPWPRRLKKWGKKKSVHLVYLINSYTTNMLGQLQNHSPTSEKKICVDSEPSLQIWCFLGPFLNCLLSRSSLCCADSGSILSEFIKMKCTNLTLPLRFRLIEEVCRGNSLTNVVTVRDSDVMRRCVKSH